MNRKTAVIGGASILVIGALIALPFLLPEKGVQLNQQVPDDVLKDGMSDGMEPDAMVGRTGNWKDGDSFHKASGKVSLTTFDGREYLHFENFDVTDGPDIYLYLTKSANPSSTKDVETDGVRINVVTDEDARPHINERGTFFVAVPDGIDTSQYGAAVIWCDGANITFGTAALR